MKEKGRPTIHPDLAILSEVLPARRGINGLNKDEATGLVFTETGKSIIDHYNKVADEIDEGKDLVFLLANTKECVIMGRKIARALRQVGLMSTEFTATQLGKVGQKKFVGGFSFRFVYPLKIT